MRMYKGLDIIFSEDDDGYYAQDFRVADTPTSQVYPSVSELMAAIDRGDCFKSVQKIGESMA